MIRLHAPADRRAVRREARRQWRSFFVVRPRVIRDERTGKRFRIWFASVDRRWSEAHRRWLWRLPPSLCCPHSDPTCHPVAPCDRCRGDVAA